VAFWRELPASAGKQLFSKGCFLLEIRLGRDYTQPCTMRVFKWSGEGRPGPFGWLPRPENCVEICGPAPWTAENLDQAKEQGQALLDRLHVEGPWKGLQERLYATCRTQQPQVVEWVESQAHPARAAILRRGHGRLEVQVYLLTLPGYGLTSPTPSYERLPCSEHEWCKAHWHFILANDLASAREAAHHYMKYEHDRYEAEIFARRYEPDGGRVYPYRGG
jgi:hypothetical protein